jgi:hypothetical protein
MWPLSRGSPSPTDPLLDLARQCQAWDRELAQSESTIADFQRELDSKTSSLDDFEGSLNKIEQDQIAFEQLISNFEQCAPPSVEPDGDPLDDVKSLYQALDYHETDLARMRAGPRTHREFLYALTDLQLAQFRFT